MVNARVIMLGVILFSLQEFGSFAKLGRTVHGKLVFGSQK